MRLSRLAIGISSAICIAVVGGIAQTSPSSGALTDNPTYQKNCAKCHGKTAAGRHFGGPSLIGEKAVSASANDLRNIINNGKGRMPKFGGKLDSEDIDTLVAQIKALAKK
jgi:cytochrome c553